MKLSMSKREVQLYLDDIFQSIVHIEEYTKGLLFEEFSKDQKTIDAVIRNFEVLGEAPARLSEEFKEEHAIVPWSAMIGMRNKVVHECFGIDPEIIWKTVQEDIPVLKKDLEKLEIGE